MNVIEIPDSQAHRSEVGSGAAQGITLKDWFGKLAEEALAALRKSLKTGRNILAKYGHAPSAEDTDENRKDMFLGFGGGS